MTTEDLLSEVKAEIEWQMDADINDFTTAEEDEIVISYFEENKSVLTIANEFIKKNRKTYLTV